MVDFDKNKLEEETCRTCCENDDVTITQMINECISHTIKFDDLLPKKICSKCFEDVKIAYYFKRKSEKSYNTLTTLLNDNLNIFINNDDKGLKYESDNNKNNDIDNDGDGVENLNFDDLFSLEISENTIPPTEKCIQTDEVSFYPCEKCDTKFFNYEALKSHRVEKHKGEINKCRICSKIYNRLFHLKKHISVEHPEVGFPVNFECTKCNKRFTRSDRLNKHNQRCHKQDTVVEETSDNLLKFFCVLCEKFFQNQKEYDIHNNECKEYNKQSNETFSAISLNEPQISLLDLKGELNEEDFLLSQDDNEKKSDESDKKINSLGISDNYSNDNIDKCTTSDEDDSISLAQLKTELNNKSDSEKLKSDSELMETTTKEKQVKFSSSPKPRKVHKCEKCNKTFTRATHVKRHALTHVDEKPFNCNICSKGFTRIDQFNLHKLKHSEVKPFVCDICNRGFVRREYLRKHKESRHSERPLNNTKKEYCEICKRFFSSAKYLQIHIKSHTERRWNCKHCKLVCNTKPELTEHMKLHANEKPFLCSECGLRFVRNDYLVIHMRRHKGEKPYKCKFCGKGFPRATDLTVHERYHTGEKTHLCTTCGKGFQRAYNLLVHTRVHTGERPYHCPHCTKSFAQGNDLKAHIRRHTGERFKCDICDCGFIQGYHLTQHKRTVHGIETQSHIRRVEKFVTPLEQQKQVEALQNKLTEEVSTVKQPGKAAEETMTIFENESSTEKLNTSDLNIDDKLFQTTTQYIVVEDSSFIPVTVNQSVFSTEIEEMKVNYENFN